MFYYLSSDLLLILPITIAILHFGFPAPKTRETMKRIHHKKKFLVWHFTLKVLIFLSLPLVKQTHTQEESPWSLKKEMLMYKTVYHSRKLTNPRPRMDFFNENCCMKITRSQRSHERTAALKTKWWLSHSYHFKHHHARKIMNFF